MPLRVIAGGKEIKLDNPLPQYFPSIYECPPEDGLARLPEFLSEAEKQIHALLSALRLTQNNLMSLLLGNLRLLFEIPEVYRMHGYLKGKGLARFHENNVAVATVLQLCVFSSAGDMAERLRDGLPESLLGVMMRYYGIGFMRGPELELLISDRKFDAADMQDRVRRNKFLESYRQAANCMSRTSHSRLRQLVGGKYKCPVERLEAMLHVARYSTRLMGRAAEKLGTEELEQVMPIAGYVAMLQNFCAAWTATGKRPGLILAEEWLRAQVSRKFKELHHTVRYNMNALQDLFQLCRCKVIPDFQSLGHDAVYSEPDNVVFRKVRLRGKGAEAEEAENAASGEGESGAEPEGDGEVRPHRQSAISSRWECVRPKGKIVHRAMSVHDAVSGIKRMGGEDPGDDMLERVE